MKQILKRVRGLTVAALMPWAIDRLAGTGVSRRGEQIDNLILAAPGSGNIGDQALLEASLYQMRSGSTVVVVENADSIARPLPGSVKVLVLPQLLSGFGLRRFRSHRAFAEIVSRTDKFYVIGADLMDGLYNPRRSVARLSTLSTASGYGVASTALGFSWPEKPRPGAARLARRLSSTVTFCLRDPRSFERFTRHGAQAVMTADVVFGDRRRAPLPDDVASWLSSNEESKVAVLNVSGLIERSIRQVHEYEPIVRRLRELGYALLFLPHVVRNGDGDLNAVESVVAAHGRSSDFVVRSELTPCQVRELGAKVDLVITGRMHLAVMAMNSLTPAVVLGTQGKVEGLCELLNVPFMNVEPTAGFGGRVADLVSDADSESTRARIASNIERVRALAVRNFGRRAHECS